MAFCSKIAIQAKAMLHNAKKAKELNLANPESITSMIAGKVLLTKIIVSKAFTQTNFLTAYLNKGKLQ